MLMHFHLVSPFPTYLLPGDSHELENGCGCQRGVLGSEDDPFEFEKATCACGISWALQIIVVVHPLSVIHFGECKETNSRLSYFHVRNSLPISCTKMQKIHNSNQCDDHPPLKHILSQVSILLKLKIGHERMTTPPMRRRFVI